MGKISKMVSNNFQCVICKHGKTKRGKTTITLERGAMILIVKNVPALVCEICGEEHIDENASRRLEEVADAEAIKGVTLEVREYAAA